MGVNACNLRRAVGAQTHHATRQLINQLEGLQVQRLAGARQQGLQMFQQGGHDQLIAIASRHVQKVSTYFFDVAGLRRQHIGNVIR